jgi:hypothetical protein
MNAPTVRFHAGTLFSKRFTYGDGFGKAQREKLESMTRGFSAFFEPKRKLALGYMERVMGAPWPEPYFHATLFMDRPARRFISHSNPLLLNYRNGTGTKGGRDYARLLYMLVHELVHRYFFQSPEFVALFKRAGTTPGQMGEKDAVYHALCDTVANHVVQATLGKRTMERVVQERAGRHARKGKTDPLAAHVQRWTREWNPKTETLLAHLRRHFQAKRKTRSAR